MDATANPSLAPLDATQLDALHHDAFTEIMRLCDQHRDISLDAITAGHWTPRGKELLARARATIAAIYERNELLQGIGAEFTRRQTADA